MAVKPNFTKKKKRKNHGANFWDTEYTTPSHLKLSSVHSGDLAKFTRWLVRQKRTDLLNVTSSVLDIGCGNGRNLIFLAREFGNFGVGFDVSKAAISQAETASEGFSLKYQVRSIAGALNLAPASQNLVLDMMTSHFLNQAERLALREEIYQVLKPGGFLFIKTFLKDEDLHTERLLKEHPGQEAGTYIHPVMGVAEYVYSEEELVNFLQERFIVHKIYRSHKHSFHGQARKRRTITIYAEKDPYR